jgi:hypothetical protein
MLVAMAPQQQCNASLNAHQAAAPHGGLWWYMNYVIASFITRGEKMAWSAIIEQEAPGILIYACALP